MYIKTCSVRFRCLSLSQFTLYLPLAVWNLALQLVHFQVGFHLLLNLAFDTSSGMFLPLLTKTLNIRCHFITSEPNFMTFYPDKILIYLTAEKNNEQFVIVALFFDEYKLK